MTDEWPNHGSSFPYTARRGVLAGPSGSAAGEHSPYEFSPANASTPDLPLRIPKNKSTGNLLNPVTAASSDGRTRFSFDAGTAQEVNGVKRTTGARPDHDNGLGVSGLRRIRRPGPPSRKPTMMLDEQEYVPPTLQSSQSMPISASQSRSVSRSASMQFLTSGPSSPVLEDVHRFPSESLHSFSFARQTEDFLHSRDTILQKSMDFMRDKSAWAANSGLINAQARVSGDAEIQGMMDLLKRAKVVPSLNTGAARSAGFGTGPMTGPADFEGQNIFEKSFSHNVETTESTPRTSQEWRRGLRKGSIHEIYEDDFIPEEEEGEGETTQSGMPTGPRKSGLKRTYTDVVSASLQQKLIEALAQPYSNDEPGQGQDKGVSAFMQQSSGVSGGMGSSVHMHGSKWTPPAQAVFRTGADAPWTIIAANDLACLTFGVTRAEVRSLSILGIIQEERRQWLEDKLSHTGPSESKPKSPAATTVMANGSSSVLGAKGGITARLLSKGPSHASKQKKAQTDVSVGGPNRPAAANPPKNHFPTKSRGVLLCGDIVPIRKRDGTLGAASFWVMEKRGGLIWVVEEVTEDVAFLSFDNQYKLIRSSGDAESIWGERLKPGLALFSLVPKITPETFNDTQCDRALVNHAFTACTMGGVNVPICVEKGSHSGELRISSLPHIAGIMVIDPNTLTISSSNSVFSSALFGYDKPNGLSIEMLIPSFNEILEILAEEQEYDLADGLVVPEHSFRRARALLALRDGTENAANIFLRPSGLLAKHRDGSDIMVDVQMRVVRSETVFPMKNDLVAKERDSDGESETQLAVSELVYAIWVTYSRQLHSAGLGVKRPEQSTKARPVTPPSQPAPALPSPPPTVDRTHSPDASRVPVVTGTLQRNDSYEPIEHPPRDTPYIPHEPKTISDFVILEEMGKGAYGEVKLARYRKSQSSKIVLKYVVKKRILVDTWTRDRRLGTVPLEIHVLDYLRSPGLRHPNIVEMVDFFEDSLNYYIEMLPHGIPGMDLFDYIELRSNMEEMECRNIFRQVVDAVHHLHIKAKVVHRDIKDENVVLDGEGQVKLIDFGSATYIKNGPFDVFVGTLDYAAPEVLQGRPYSGQEQDVWALGILLYTLVYRENPFYNIDEILDHPLRVPFIPFQNSELCIDLIRGMLDRDVEQRITIEGVMNHEWLLQE